MGSPSGLWTAVSGGMAQSQNIDTIANNIANTNTTGFKSDTPLFKEYLTTHERYPSGETMDIPRTIFRDSDFYHHQGREHAKVNLNGMSTNHTQGALRPTNGQLDMAVDGVGFFTVKTPVGFQFTRSGEFKVNAAGQLVTNDGFPVMVLGPEALQAKAAFAAQAESPISTTEANRAPASLNAFLNEKDLPPGTKEALVPINLRQQLEANQKLSVMENGEIYSGTQLLGTLAIARFVDPRMLQKTNSTLYLNSNKANVAVLDSNSRIHQGFLEASNVNSVGEMVNLLKANRMYESNMKAIKAYSEMATKEANEVGKL